MDRIRLLPESVKKKIAAGEVVEGPFSVVKELVENALDAGATAVDVSVVAAGMKQIVVRDNGHGIHPDDLPLAVAEHATSKIADIGDIETIHSYGFRGEALSSISSVSRLTLCSRRKEDDIGVRLVCDEGRNESGSYAGPAGTMVIVENLFYNVPARKKFLGRPGTELRRIREVFLRLAVPHPAISFTFEADGKRQFTLTSTESLEERLTQVFGKEAAQGLMRASLKDDRASLSGFFSRPDSFRSNRSMQILYINKRPVEYRYFSFLLSKAYDAAAEKGMYPAGIVFIDLDPALVDVNIHPAKREVKVFDARYLDTCIVALAEKALSRDHKIEPSRFHAGAAQELHPVRPWRREGAPEGQSSAHTPHLPWRDAVSPRQIIQEAGDLYRYAREQREWKIIGTAFGTYCIFEKGDSLFLVDFHAAHERIIYDSLMMRREEPEIQRLVFPRVIELTAEDHAMVIENIESFTRFGFDMEDFSGTSIKVSAVPAAAGEAQLDDLFHEVMNTIRDERLEQSLAERIAASVACHAAKMAGERLSSIEMEKLARTIFSDEAPRRCPHGRPFVYRIDRADIEKLFKRQ